MSILRDRTLGSSKSLDRGKKGRLIPGPSTLRTGHADLPRPALQSVGSTTGLTEGVNGNRREGSKIRGGRRGTAIAKRSRGSAYQLSSSGPRYTHFLHRLALFSAGPLDQPEDGTPHRNEQSFGHGDLRCSGAGCRLDLEPRVCRKGSFDELRVAFDPGVWVTHPGRYLKPNWSGSFLAL